MKLLPNNFFPISIFLASLTVEIGYTPVVDSIEYGFVVSSIPKCRIRGY